MTQISLWKKYGKSTAKGEARKSVAVYFVANLAQSKSPRNKGFRLIMSHIEPALAGLAGPAFETG